ncbi:MULTISPECIES: GFA family protein [unclassified Ruegeria]|uniref:GFA family protein n=1 Tax=unclassified Ruegeria TaxID=2625375 RepID=UPI0014877A66|nr:MULTISPECIES: GFA family protein [unclassified Ruegeria]
MYVNLGRQSQNIILRISLGGEVTDYPNKAEGGCFCGNIRFEVAVGPDYVAYCHCKSCRKSTGAPAVVYVTYQQKDVIFTKGKRKKFASSEGVSRTFCKDCGTPISYEAEWNGNNVIGFFVGTMDEPDFFPAQKHVAHRERLTWFDASDNLPRFLEFPRKDQVPDSKNPAV